MNGEYITELEALQVVAGDVLKENRRVRLVGEAEEPPFPPNEEYDMNNFRNDVEELASRFRLGIEVKYEGEIRKDQKYGSFSQHIRYDFVRPVVIPFSAISDWSFFDEDDKNLQAEYVEIRDGEAVNWFQPNDESHGRYISFSMGAYVKIEGRGTKEIAYNSYSRTFGKDESVYMELAKLIKSMRDFLIKNEAPRGSIARVVPDDQTDNSEEPASTDSGSSSGGLAGQVQKMLVDDILTNFKNDNYPVRFMGINEVEGSDYFGYDFVCNPIDGSKVLDTDEDVRLYILRLLIAPGSTRFGWYLMGQAFSGDNPTGDMRSIELHDFGSNAASSFGDFIKLNDAAMKPMIEKLKKMPPYEG